MKTAPYLPARVIQAIGVLGVVLCLSQTALAAVSESFQISPPTSNYSGNKGTTVSGILKVTNLTGQPLNVTVGKENFVAKGEEGQVELVDNADPLYSLAPWFNFNSSTLTIPGLGTSEVGYTIAIPPNAEPGGRYGSITISSIPPTLPSGQSGASVEQQLASLIFLRINGPANENLSVLTFGADKNFYEYGPVNLTTRIKNNGNVHEKPTGTITIRNMLGFKVASIPLDQHFVIPTAVRRLTNQWPSSNKRAMLFGDYTATLNATYAPGKTLTAVANFWVIPYKLVAAVLIILILIILLVWRGRKRFGRALRILAGKE